MALSSTGLWSSLLEVKPYLRLAYADVSHDAVLETLCNAVSEEIELATNRIYVTRTVSSERHSGDGTTRLVLKYYPVTSVTSITQDSTTVDTSYYWLDGDAGVVWRDTGTWTEDDPGNILVTYVAGYARASIPALVTQTALELLRHRYTDWSAGADTTSQMAMGGTLYQPRSTWPYQVKDAIERLRRQYRAGVW